MNRPWEDFAGLHCITKKRCSCIAIKTHVPTKFNYNLVIIMYNHWGEIIAWFL